MKNINLILSAFTLCTLLCSCPYSSSFLLDETPITKINEEIIGSWATFISKPASEKLEPIKLIISKKNNEEYNIAITGNIQELKKYNVIEKDSIFCTAFISTILQRQFLNVTIKGLNYIVECRIREGKLSMLPMSEKFTAKLIRSNADLKNNLVYHLNTFLHTAYDDNFCLKEMIKVN